MSETVEPAPAPGIEDLRAAYHAAQKAYQAEHREFVALMVEIRTLDLTPAERRDLMAAAMLELRAAAAAVVQAALAYHEAKRNRPKPKPKPKPEPQPEPAPEPVHDLPLSAG